MVQAAVVVRSGGRKRRARARARARAHTHARTHAPKAVQVDGVDDVGFTFASVPLGTAADTGRLIAVAVMAVDGHIP